MLNLGQRCSMKVDKFVSTLAQILSEKNNCNVEAIITKKAPEELVLPTSAKENIFD